jgi:GTPase SAR1 family protein
MYLVYLIGTAGAGKSLLTRSFTEWLKSRKHDVISVNLDPGVVSLPYEPDVDIRDYISIQELMEKQGLGPNGALIAAVDLLATSLWQLQEEIASSNSDYAIIDTPGQMELFCFRASGPYIARELSAEGRAVVYLFDASFSSNPFNYVSNLFLSSAVYIRFQLPQIHILSKIDLLPAHEAKRVLNWSTRVRTLDNAIERVRGDETRLLSRELMSAISKLGLTFNLTPVSARTTEGFNALLSLLTRIFTGGEEAL